MAAKAKEAVNATELTVVADRGYFKARRSWSARIGIRPLVPKSMTSSSLAAGRFDKADFIYVASDNEYRCPAGQRAIYRYTSMEDGLPTDTLLVLKRARACAIRAQCTPAATDESSAGSTLLSRGNARAARSQARQYASAATHGGTSFGTLKFWMGAVHF